MRREGAAILISLDDIDSHLATAVRPPTFQGKNTLHVSEWGEGGEAVLIAKVVFEASLNIRQIIGRGNANTRADCLLSLSVSAAAAVKQDNVNQPAKA